MNIVCTSTESVGTPNDSVKCTKNFIKNNLADASAGVRFWLTPSGADVLHGCPQRELLVATFMIYEVTIDSFTVIATAPVSAPSRSSTQCPIQWHVPLGHRLLNELGNT